MMTLSPTSMFGALWLAWTAYWLWSAQQVKSTARQEPLGSRLLHLVPLGAAMLLLWSKRVPLPWLAIRLWSDDPRATWLGLALTVLGLGFSVWARVHLGSNWSGTVTVKTDHALVDTGPYALVRHPIYTGLLTAILGGALSRGDLRGLLAFGLAWASLVRKMGLEERWMGEVFGERYAAYRRQVPALLPFGRRR